MSNGMGYRARDAEAPANAPQVCQHVGSIYGKGPLDDVSGLFERELFQGKDYEFNGNAYIALPALPDVGVATTGFILSAWVRPNDTNSHFIVCYNSSYNSTGSRNMLYMASGQFLLFAGGSTAEVTSSPYTIDEWHHVVGVSDGSTVELFVNGVSQGTSSAVSNYDSDYPTYVGASYSHTNGGVYTIRFHDGGLQNVQIAPFSSSERDNLLADQNHVIPGNVCFMKCDDPNYYNSNGSGNNGTGFNIPANFIADTTELKSWRNEAGYSMPDYIPRNESAPHLDAGGNTLTHPHRAKKNAAFRNSNVALFNGTNSASFWTLSFQRTDMVNQMIAAGSFTTYLGGEDLGNQDGQIRRGLSDSHELVIELGQLIFRTQSGTLREVAVNLPADFNFILLSVDFGTNEVTVQAGDNSASEILDDIPNITVGEWDEFFSFCGVPGVINTITWNENQYTGIRSAEHCANIEPEGLLRCIPYSEGEGNDFHDVGPNGWHAERWNGLSTDWGVQDHFSYNAIHGCERLSATKLIPAQRLNPYQRADGVGTITSPAIGQFHDCESELCINPHDDPKILELTGETSADSEAFPHTNIRALANVSWQQDNGVVGQYSDYKVIEP